MNNNFIFTDDVAGYSAGSVLVNVPKAINSKTDLLALLARGLSFPDTFGANWDALFDCLCDLSWVQEKRVVIAHEGVPTLTAEGLRTYLGVLNDAVASWRDNPGAHELIVVFPPNTSTALP